VSVIENHFRRSTVTDRCAVRGIPYLSGNHVYVRAVGTDPRDRVAQDFWVARILQIRAANPKHVYALVREMVLTHLNCILIL
jgi:hypothetical protein